MSTLDWLKEYNSELYTHVTDIMGGSPSPYYDEELLGDLKQYGVKGFYFNAINGDSDTAPEWLPDNHRLATMILWGRATRASSITTNRIYEKALNEVPQGGRLHTILYFRDTEVEFQSLFSLGNLNKHRAMGAQAIVGSPTTGFLKAVTEFVSLFAGRRDIFQLDDGEWLDGLNAIEKYVREEYLLNT